MLVHARMKRVALATALVAASSGAASAGGYIGLGIGTGPNLSTSDDARIESDGRSARLMLGYRINRFSIEGAVGGYDVVTQIDRGFYPIKIRQGSISGKYNLPISDGFEAFGRIGLNKTWWSMDDSRFDADGTGIILGAGMAYQIRGLSGASIWLDYQYSRAGLEGELTKTDLNAAMWTLGATIGF